MIKEKRYFENINFSFMDFTLVFLLYKAASMPISTPREQEATNKVLGSKDIIWLIKLVGLSCFDKFTTIKGNYFLDTNLVETEKFSCWSQDKRIKMMKIMQTIRISQKHWRWSVDNFILSEVNDYFICAAL